MSEIIATIKLCPGHAGFYDDLTRIHLTIGRPIANVYAGMNCSQLRHSVKAGTIEIIDGSFGEDAAPYRLVKRQDGSLAISLKSKLKDAVKELGAVPKKKKDESKAKAEAEKAPAAPAAAESTAEEKNEAAAPVKDEKPAKKTPAKKATKKAAAKKDEPKEVEEN